jgi:acyl-CoA synthetase (AMP-forming)/AMP-acid ligase II
MISHRSIITNMMQMRWFDSVHRRAKGIEMQTSLGLLPLSHVYGLLVVALASIYQGDSVILLPKFELKNLLQSIQRFKINELFLVSLPASTMQQSLL